ncbi:hypothetical protein B0H14DRAFT_2630942 [Mycena olivaceomarginata]|nr:hypothetical protein B0H14DRAFT_2630942 [Mycena olivaceomarginata]
MSRSDHLPMSFTTHRWYSVAAQEAVFERSMNIHFKSGNWSRDQIIKTGQIERWHKGKLAKAIDRIKYYIYHLQPQFTRQLFSASRPNSPLLARVDTWWIGATGVKGRVSLETFKFQGGFGSTIHTTG